jgi:threonine/homoserine/homoserine lactone efflux protein
MAEIYLSIQALLTSPTFAAFLFASLILAVTPGPGVIYIVTRTLGQGRKAGFASIGGIALGDLGNAAAASLGLAAVLSASANAFVIVKLAGAAYLVFLGLKALWAKPAMAVAAPTTRLSPARLFCDGFLVALLNPKTALFFAALLPQFIDPGASPLWQSLVLSCVFVAIAVCTDTLYMLTASALAPAISRRGGSRSYGRYITAATFIGLGVYAALANPRPAK